MIKQRLLDLMVGFFVLVAVLILFVISSKASTIHSFDSDASYVVTASFDDLGGLSVNSPVRIAGVKVGEVVSIDLDNLSYRAIVKASILQKYNAIPNDSSMSIMTEGLLGSKYISISPGFSGDFLANGDKIEVTHSALILENLISKFLFKP